MTENENIFEETDINLDVEAEENLIGLMATAETAKEAKEAADALKAMQEAKKIKQDVDKEAPDKWTKQDKIALVLGILSAAASIAGGVLGFASATKEVSGKLAIAKAQTSLEREELYVMADKCRDDLPNTAPIDAKRKLNRKR